MALVSRIIPVAISATGLMRMPSSGEAGLGEVALRVPRGEKVTGSLFRGEDGVAVTNVGGRSSRTDRGGDGEVVAA